MRAALKRAREGTSILPRIRSEERWSERERIHSHLIESEKDVLATPLHTLLPPSGRYSS